MAAATAGAMAYTASGLNPWSIIRVSMRSFAYKNPDYIKDEFIPELIEDNPCYQQSAYDSVMYDETPDGDLIQADMTQILMNQEKYRRLLGDMNVQNILAQMHPTQSTIMDGMTDEERFNCVISRHCQTMSERQAVLQQLAGEKSELTKYAEAMLAEQKSEPVSASAPDTAVQ